MIKMDTILKTKDFIPEGKDFTSRIAAESRQKLIHAHDFYEIAYIISSYGTHTSEENTCPVSEGMYIMISPGAYHATTASENTTVARIRVCNCLFEKRFFESVVARFLSHPVKAETELHKILKNNLPYCLVLSDNSAHTISSIFKTIKYECNHNSPYTDKTVELMLEIFLMQTSQLYHTDTFSTHTGNSEDRRLEELLTYMKSNLDLPLTLNDLAGHIHFTPEYLSRYFKKHTGKTIMRHLSELRIEKARELLMYTQYPISEICYMCGYSSLANFRKYFSKISGMSPTAFRDHMLHN